MYRMCTTEKSALQQRKIEDTMISMMLEQDYEDITISELCQRAGLSRKIFYRLFDKKGDVLDALLDHTFLDFMIYEADPGTAVGGLHSFFQFFKDKKELLDALQKSDLEYLLTDRAMDFVFQEDAARLRHFGADVDEFGREIMLFYLNGIFSLVYDWHDRGYEKTVDQMCTLIMRLFSTTAVKSGAAPESW